MHRAYEVSPERQREYEIGAAIRRLASDVSEPGEVSRMLGADLAADPQRARTWLKVLDSTVTLYSRDKRIAMNSYRTMLIAYVAGLGD